MGRSWRGLIRRSTHDPGFLGGAPLHVSNPNGDVWLADDDEVVAMLNAIQVPLRQKNYSNTIILDRRSTFYNERAISIDVIWSRRNYSSVEIERRAVHFEIRKLDGVNRIIAFAAKHTSEARLDAVFSYNQIGSSREA